MVYNSITYPQYGSFCIKENKLKLASVDGLIKLELHRLRWKDQNVYNSKRYWKMVCFSCNNDIQKSSSDIVGVDVGLLNWMMLSNGEIIDRPTFLGAGTLSLKK